MILGLLADGPLHGYALRRRMEQLHGHARSVSDGALYPALRRLRDAGAIVETVDERPRIAAAERRTLALTDAGRSRLEEILRGADGALVSDQSRFFVVLAFLSHLPDPGGRTAVLRRRLAFLEGGRSFFVDAEDRPLRSAQLEDPYRRGMLRIARDVRATEVAWLREQIEDTPAPSTPTEETP